MLLWSVASVVTLGFGITSAYFSAENCLSDSPSQMGPYSVHKQKSLMTSFLFLLLIGLSFVVYQFVNYLKTE